jgi:Tol biopolymer transport system component
VKKTLTGAFVFAVGLRLAPFAIVMLAAADGRTHEFIGTVHAIARQRIFSAQVYTTKSAAISRDGQLIAFVADDALPGTNRCCRNISVLDRSTGALTLESGDPGGITPMADSDAPTLSAAGEFVAFETLAPIPSVFDGRVGTLHVVVRNRRDGTLRTPLALDGGPPDGITSQPALSADGAAVAFTSEATNLVPDIHIHGPAVFVWRLDSSTITQVNVASDGLPRSGASHTPSISAVGDLIAFVSTARLVPEDENAVSDVYVRDVTHGRTMLVSRAVDGRAADGQSYSPALSADGRYVAFTSRAGNLVSNDHNQESDVYVRDLATATTSLVSATAHGTAANAGSSRAALSENGRWIVFQSQASNLGSRHGCPATGRDQNLLSDIYLFDQVTGCVSRISGSPSGDWWNPSVAPSISGLGEVIVFSSTQPAGDDDLSTDVDLFAWSCWTSRHLRSLRSTTDRGAVYAPGLSIATHHGAAAAVATGWRAQQ